MLNEDKVIMMTKMAAYEKHAGRKNLNIVNYYRSDYIGFQMLKAFLAAVISFVAALAIYAFYNFEEIMSDIYTVDYVGIAKNLGVIFLVVVGIYMLLCYILYATRYSKAKKELKGFYANLRKLAKRE